MEWYDKYANDIIFMDNLWIIELFRIDMTYLSGKSEETPHCILQSATHQISHTKGGVFASLGIYFEGSTNWSSSGEGAGISLKSDVKNPAGFKAQNNTLMVSTNSVNFRRFQVQLDLEHQVGLAQVKKRAEQP